MQRVTTVKPGTSAGLTFDRPNNRFSKQRAVIPLAAGAPPKKDFEENNGEVKDLRSKFKEAENKGPSVEVMDSRKGKGRAETKRRLSGSSESPPPTSERTERSERLESKRNERLSNAGRGSRGRGSRDEPKGDSKGEAKGGAKEETKGESNGHSRNKETQNSRESREIKREINTAFSEGSVSRGDTRPSFDTSTSRGDARTETSDPSVVKIYKNFNIETRNSNVSSYFDGLCRVIPGGAPVKMYEVSINLEKGRNVVLMYDLIFHFSGAGDSGSGDDERTTFFHSIGIHSESTNEASRIFDLYAKKVGIVMGENYLDVDGTADNNENLAGTLLVGGIYGSFILSLWISSSKPIEFVLPPKVLLLGSSI